MTEIFVRYASDDDCALLQANAMESFEGCEVISISGNKVWAKYDPDKVTLTAIDGEISKRFEEAKGNVYGANWY